MTSQSTPAAVDPGIRLEQHGVIGFLVLQRPATLNALDSDMIDALHQGLETFEADASIELIIIRSECEKAFCAGGDMKHIRALCLESRFDDAIDFFTREYALNLAIARCSKPYLALINGIAMGGGLGVSIHGRYRIVTPESRLAMPETRIGYFPDVGASYFLPRLGFNAGYWLGLTAMAITGNQAVLCGMATHCISSDNLYAFPERLKERLRSSGASRRIDIEVDTLLKELEMTVAPQDESEQLKNRAIWFSDPGLQAIGEKLSTAADESDDARTLLELLNGASPFSLRVTTQLLAMGKHQELDACLSSELAMAGEACRHADLVEGVRAVLVDKDRRPQWQEPKPDS